MLAYLLLAKVGREAEVALLSEVTWSTNRLEPFSTFDGDEARAVIEQYAGFGDVGLSDASNVVLARRHDARRIRVLRELPFCVLPAES